ncbi:MAG: hypothetical protein ACRD9W_08860, partial [Terriglobia bacterium]
LHVSLRAIAARKWLAMADMYTEIPIALNVRRGKDFEDASDESEFYSRGPLRTPLSWFIRTLQEIRSRLGVPRAPAYVVSDGTEQDLEPLLRINDVHLVESRSAISDLLILAKARLLIGSGGSSFSAWASFLGQMPTVSHPGQSLNWFKVSGDSSAHYVGEYLVGDENAEFFSHPSVASLPQRVRV